MTESQDRITRRSFVGALTAGYFGLDSLPAWAQAGSRRGGGGPESLSAEEFDSLAKLAFNENAYGPPETVIEALRNAMRFANRYAYPDGGLVPAIAELHGVRPENVVLGAGSTEVLQMAAAALLGSGKKVVGVEPTFGSVYEFATGLKCESVRVPLRADYGQDVTGLLRAVKENGERCGFVYICNPNNPTGRVMSSAEVKELVTGMPEDVVVLVDEAYHHFVEDREYSSSESYVREGRPVIVTRTFSKIAGLAGVRLGYGIAPAELAGRLRAIGSRLTVSALAKWAGVAALKDTGAQVRVRDLVVGQRKRTVEELGRLGFESIPSEANFFMVNIKRPVPPVIRAFHGKGVLVGRPFPPMLQHLRVSIGTDAEMDRFLAAFKQVLA